MCLAVPGKILEWMEREPPFAQAVVEFGGVRRHINMACVPEAIVGDYVLVHAGVAITCINAEDAARLLDSLKTINESPWDELAPDGNDEIPG